MSKAELLEVIADLPEKCLERVIADCLVQLMAHGEYFAADQIVQKILAKVRHGDRLCLKARVIGVQIACRNDESDLAIARYMEQERFSSNMSDANAKRVLIK